MCVCVCACDVQLLLSIQPLYCPCQESKWARTKKGTAAGGACLECSVVTTRAFPHLTWEQVLAKTSASAEVEASLKAAKKLWQSLGSSIERDEKGFLEQDFSHSEHVAVKMSRGYKFLADSDFEAIHGMKPAQAGLVSVVLPSETGTPTSGILFPDDDYPIRRVVVSHSDTSRLSEILHAGAKQLRPQQGSDFQQAWQTEAAKSWPALLQGKQKESEPSTLKEICDRVEAAKKKAAEAPRVQAAPPLQAATVECGQEKESDDEVQEASELAAAAAAATAVRPSSGKGKGRGRGGGSATKKRKEKHAGEAQTKKLRSQASCATSVATSSVTDGGSSTVSGALRSASSARSRSPKAASLCGSDSKVEGLLKQASKYKQKLPPSVVLLGRMNGQDLNQAKRIHRALEAKPVCNDAFLDLGAHLELVAAALKLSMGELGGLRKDEREELLQHVFPKLDAVPGEWAAALLCCHIREEAQILKPADVNGFVAKIFSKDERSSGCLTLS